jgi:hypothetical protein
MRHAFDRLLLTLLPFAVMLLVLGEACDAEPRPDAGFRPTVDDPGFRQDTGPLVCVDEGHHNFHRLDGLFGPFGALLAADGYRVRSTTGSFAGGPARECRVLVVANAQPGDQPWDHYEYPTPPAFAREEITGLLDWVHRGGRLLLIADHMPFPGAAADLASAFGCTFNDGFAVAPFTTEAEGRAAFLEPTIFSVENGLLGTHPITAGPAPYAAVPRVATFAGQAFRCGPDAAALLVLPRGFVSLMPRTAWQFTLETLQVPVGGWLQGAVLERGRGRIAIFGEGGMFTAQVTDDGRLMGMNAPGAEHNARFVRNVVRWLAGP